MSNLRRREPLLTVRQHVRSQSFRFLTTILGWAAVIAAFYEKPELIKWSLRTSTHAIEAVGDSIPYPWGDRVEIILRELGGSFWLQIATVIIVIRLALWIVGRLWRSLRDPN